MSNEHSNTSMFLACCVVVTPFYFAIKYWYVTVFILLFALVLATIGYVVYVIGEDNMKTAHRKAEIIKRAEEQHEALMNGNNRLGVHGKYPPAI